MKQRSLKKRKISQIAGESLLQKVNLFIPPKQPVEKSLKDRVQWLGRDRKSNGV